MKKSVKFLRVLLVAARLFGGCLRAMRGTDMFFNKNKYRTGGKIDHTDARAPKVIESTEIENFRTYFYLYNPPFDYDGHNYSFEIVKNADGSFTLKETARYNLECDITKEEIMGVQEIIAKHDLVKINGKDRYTAGLRPEYAPVMIRAEYASGESLYIREDGNPESPVFKDFLRLFLGLFEAKGFTEVMPAPERMVFTRFDLQYSCDGRSCEYLGVITDSEAGEKKLWRNIWEAGTNKVLADDEISMPEDFYAQMSALVKEHNLMSAVNYRTRPFGFDGTCDYMHICIENIEDEQFNMFYSAEDGNAPLTPQLTVAAKAIAAEIDKYFE